MTVAALAVPASTSPAAAEATGGNRSRI